MMWPKIRTMLFIARQRWDSIGCRPLWSFFITIEEEFHKWEEHELGADELCLVLVRPEERLLGVAEVLDLLDRSARWLDQVPDMELLEIRLPNDSRLNVPPALPPLVPHLSLPEIDTPEAPDTDAGVSFPGIGSSETPFAPDRTFKTQTESPEVVIGVGFRPAGHLCRSRSVAVSGVRPLRLLYSV